MVIFYKVALKARLKMKWIQYDFFFQFLNIKCSKVVWHFIKVSKNCTTPKKNDRNVTLNYSAEITVELSHGGLQMDI